MKANKIRNELKVSDSNTYQLKTEERMKNGEEQRKIFTDLLTKTSRKCYGSTSVWIFFMETHFFSTQNCLNAQHRGQGPLKLNLLPLFIGEMGRCLPPRGFLRKISERTQLLSSPPFSYFTEKLWKPYRSILDLIFLFFLFPFTNIK